jgi:hypothetical protein
MTEYKKNCGCNNYYKKKEKKEKKKKYHEKTNYKKLTNFPICEQQYYAPLPNLAFKPSTEFIRPIEWFAPGSVQTSCSICSTVKPIYIKPYTYYCC